MNKLQNTYQIITSYAINIDKYHITYVGYNVNLLMDRKEALEKMQIRQPYKCRGKADLKMTHWLFAKKPSNNLLRDVQ